MDAPQVTPETPDRSAHAFELEHFLPYWLSVLTNTVSQGIAQYYQQEYGLSVPEWRVMAVLGRFPGLTASELCERTVMDKVTISRAVNALLGRGCLERVTDASDRRKRPLRIRGPEGTRILEAVIPHALDYQSALLSGLSSDELATFRKVAERLLAIATQLNERGHPVAESAPQPPRHAASG